MQNYLYIKVYKIIKNIPNFTNKNTFFNILKNPKKVYLIS